MIHHITRGFIIGLLRLLVRGILFWYDFWISGWNSCKHWHYWIHNGLSREIMIITLRPLRGCRPQHMKCATNLWKTKLQLFDSLVPAVFTMTAQADQAGADAAPQHSDNSTYFVLIALAASGWIEWWASERDCQVNIPTNSSSSRTNGRWK